jgi:hypothetical protein
MRVGVLLFAGAAMITCEHPQANPKQQPGSACASPCAAPTPFCDESRGVCVECFSPNDCRDKPMCGPGGRCVRCTELEGGCESLGNPRQRLCDPSNGRCGECLSNADCVDPDRPACDQNQCTVCLGDVDCLGSGPGVCLQWRCATDEETAFVQNDPAICSNAGPGTRASPFCRLDWALTAAPLRVVVAISGPVDGFRIRNGLFDGEWTVAGVDGTGATIFGGPDPAVWLQGNVFFHLHRLTVAGGADVGILVHQGASIDLDAVTVRENAKGGLLVTDGGYSVTNSLFVDNGGVPDNAGRLIGGAYLDPRPTDPGPPVSAPGTFFAFNTVVANRAAGVFCADSQQEVQTSLLFGNEGDVRNCHLSGSTTSANGDPLLQDQIYKLTAESPCRNAISGYPYRPPRADIDGTIRPRESKLDCGADEFAP